MLKLGSLFDGIGGFCLAAQQCGIEPVWASEIEEKPIMITRKHFPSMKHLGDITKINGAEIEPVDIISFGSPCQDLSVAGKGAGLAGERSGLFHAAIRIIREMRLATDGRYPRWIVWENVPGAFSSQKGRDFGAVVSEIAETEIPTPSCGKWATAGMVELQDRAICWRVLDAQYWGVPQRRKRVFVVASFGDNSAYEILFKPESMSGHIEQSRAERETATSDAKNGAGKTICIAGNIIGRKHSHGGHHLGVQEDIAYTLTTGDVHAVCFNSKASTNDNMPVLDISPTLRAQSGAAVCFEVIGCGEYLTTGDVHAVVFENHSGDSRITGPHNICQTLNKRMGTGGGNLPLCFGFRGYGDYKQTDKSKTLMRCDDITTVDLILASGKSCTGTILASCADKQFLGNQEAFSGDFHVIDNYAARRLIPLECERLQGFPDNWTAAGVDENGIVYDISDTQRYRAIGNSVAVCCVEYIMHNISKLER